MTKSLFAVALSAGIIAFGGAAFAQSSGSSESGTIPGKTMHKSMKGVTPTKALVGKDVVNAKGEKIGEVDSIDGNMVIVGVGGFLRHRRARRGALSRPVPLARAPARTPSSRLI